MSRKILLFMLAASFVFECVLIIGGFATPTVMFESYGLQVSNDTLFLGRILAWCFLFIAAVCLVAFLEVRKGTRQGISLSYVLGAWWIAVGIAVYLTWGTKLNLLIDSLKGAIIFFSALNIQRRIS